MPDQSVDYCRIMRFILGLRVEELCSNKLVEAVVSTCAQSMNILTLIVLGCGALFTIILVAFSYILMSRKSEA